jgi:hypothetical protein
LSAGFLISRKLSVGAVTRPQVFTTSLMGSVAMDRLVHRTAEIVTEGKSYRLDSFVKTSQALTQVKQQAT